MKKIVTTLLICLVTSLSFAQNIKAFEDKNTGFIGFKNAKGEIIIEPTKYEEWDGASEGLILVGKKDKWGFIDLQGNEVIELKYKYASKFSDGLACVSVKKDKYGFIDKTGATIIDFKFEDTHPFNENTAGVSKNNKWGFIDKSGQIINDY